jgi:hypothetical protein
MPIFNDRAGNVTNVPAGAVNVDAAVAANPGLRLLGYSIKETAGAPAEFEIVQGATGAGGTGLGAHQVLAANANAQSWMPDGIKVPGGISVRRVAGTAKLAITTKVVI